MTLALVGIFYLMRALDSGDVERSISNSGSGLGILIGSDLRPLNWCPPSVTKIEIYSPDGVVIKTFESAVELSRLCELMVGGFHKASEQEPTFYKKMRAFSAAGETLQLDQATQPGLYRVQGMPFSSPMLNSALKALLGS